MTSSKESPKAQTRTTAPVLARDHANVALVKLMQSQQAALNNSKSNTAPAATTGAQSQPAAPTIAKKSG